MCAVNNLYANQVIDNIHAYDVNGLYGYVMDEKRLPYGQPYYDDKQSINDFSFIDFWCEFESKDGYFPMLQIKTIQYAGKETKYLTHSDGITHLFLTEIDYDLMHKHYHVYNEYGNSYISFQTKENLLSPIIQENLRLKEYYSQEDTKDEYLRQVSKDNTNMLYGSFGLSTENDIVTPYMEGDCIHMKHTISTKEGRYIPIASAITSHARAITINAIQHNHDIWIYSDTDSMYTTKPARGIPIHQTQSGKWKYETWDNCGEPFPHGKFLRQKTYCLADENYNIYMKNDKYGNLITECKCAGMPESIKKTVKWDEFHLGANFGTRKQHCVVPGGVCLIDREYKIE